MKRLAIITLNNPGELAARTLADAINLKRSDVYSVEIWIKERSESAKEDFPAPETHTKNSTRNASTGNYSSLDTLLDQIWEDSDIILFLAATGIVVRKIARKLESKYSDPAVLIADFALSFMLPLLSGHVGGGNAAATDLAEILPGCRALLTTGTDQENLPSFDLFAKEKGFSLENPEMLARVSNALLNGETLQVFAPSILRESIRTFSGFSHPSLQYREIEIEDLYRITESVRNASYAEAVKFSVHIHPLPYESSDAKNTLRIRVRPFWIGCGMNRGTTEEAVSYAIRRFLGEHGLLFEDIAGLASFEKKEDEEGLLSFARKANLPLVFFDDERINSLNNEFSESMAGKYFGIKGVAEPCAVLTSTYGYLFLRKHIYGDVTLAAAI